MIGPNGSGKTTLLNIVNGVVRPDGGTVLLEGKDTVGRRPSALASIGLTRTFQRARVFDTLTVAQNLMIPLLHAGRSTREGAARRAEELLALVALRMVLMDEPFAGVHPEIKKLLIRRIRATVEGEGTSFLVVSHEVPDLVAMSRFMLCLVEGKLVAAGPPYEVVRDDKVIEGYLGRRQEAT